LNNPRANIANLIAAGGGVLLILSLFLGWFGAGDESVNGWESFTLADIVLLVIAVAAIALGAAHATGQAASLPDFLRLSLLKWIGTVALTISFFFALELTSGQFEADVKFGAILAVLGSAAILAGGILNDRPDLAAKLNEATAGLGGGPSAGPGPGASPGPGTPAVGAPPATPAAQPAPAAEPQQPATAPQPAATPAAESAAAESSGPAPGWYPDPQGQKRLRYWDGSRWTEQTAD
jgi:pyruvate/2-oxoglutarate dehydrogenase complex dihydrolipoamide acyltransferase (E2) component